MKIKNNLLIKIYLLEKLKWTKLQGGSQNPNK